MSISTPDFQNHPFRRNLSTYHVQKLAIAKTEFDRASILRVTMRRGPRMMRYELTDYEWAAIRPMLPNKARGVPRVDDRGVLNGICWVLRSGAPWRALPDCYGPCTTCYNRFVRWRRAGVWGRIMYALPHLYRPEI